MKLRTKFRALVTKADTPSGYKPNPIGEQTYSDVNLIKIMTDKPIIYAEVYLENEPLPLLIPVHVIDYIEE